MAASKSYPLPTIPGVQLEKLIGKGGMGKVYQGKQTYLGRTVAIKVLYSDVKVDSNETDRRFRREAKLLAGMSQPNIVGCYDGGVTAAGQYFLIMEFIDGPDLGRFIREKGSLPEKTSVQIIRDMAQALDHALQKGIIHRDVKAENILLQKVRSPAAGETFPYVCKLADLGLARYQEQPDPKEQLTHQGSIFGTPQIMAPEQFQDQITIDYRVDIYALGCLLYQCLHGRTPFDSGSFSAIVAKKVTGELPAIEAAKYQLKPKTTALIQQMMAYDIKKRPGSYQEIVSACDIILSNSGSRSEPLPRRHVTVEETLQDIQYNAAPSLSQSPEAVKSFPIGKTLLILLFLAMVSIGGFFWPTRIEDKQELPAVQNDMIQENPGSERPQSPEPVVFSKTGIPLFPEDYFTRLQDWEKEGSWGPEDDGPGVIGVAGENLAICKLPNEQAYAKWSGTIRLQGSIEAGSGIELASGETYALRIQHLGSQALCTLAKLEKQDHDQSPVLSPYGDKNIVIETDPSTTDMMFTIELNARYLTFSINHTEIDRILVNSSCKSFFLINEKGATRFRDIMAYNEVSQ